MGDNNNLTGIFYGCIDPMGEHEPEIIFNEKIYPILKRYNLTDHAIKSVAEGIREMCEMSYSNGMMNEAFCNSDEGI